MQNHRERQFGKAQNLTNAQDLSTMKTSLRSHVYRYAPQYRYTYVPQYRILYGYVDDVEVKEDEQRDVLSESADGRPVRSQAPTV